MRISTFAVIICCSIFAVAGCNGSDGSGVATGDISLDSQMDQVSYSIGFDIGRSFVQGEVDDINTSILARGMEDALAEVDPAITMEEMQAVMQAFQLQMSEKQQASMLLMQEENQIEASAFLAENAVKEGVISIADSLQYIVLEAGTGASPTESDMVLVHYSGQFIDGTVFDSSYDRGEPITFPVSGVIPGWSTLLTHMKVGDKWRAFIPPALAYGPTGNASIPPNKLLVFEMELLDIVTDAE